MDIGLGSAGITLEARYLESGAPVLLSGIQALVRLLLEQARRDKAAGLRTAGLVSGYRGSPLGGLDLELWKRGELLAEHDIRFQPGLNEDLAATMLWGAQQLDFFPGKRVDGVFGLWYGKGPGVDRSGDALRCANMLGTHRHGGVLAVAGDDHGAHSSTYPHQTDQLFEALMIPVLHPADAGEIVTLGLAGYALSRFSGLWVALKTIAETAEQSRSVIIPAGSSFIEPADFIVPPHGLNLDPNLRWPAERVKLESRVIEERLPAALAWARANRLDRTIAGDADAPIGIVAVGKALHDVQHALRLLGLDGAPWIAIRKVAMAWPLETDGMREFARGKRALLVVEEKRGFVESQLRNVLYNLPADARPAISGKSDLAGATLMPASGELSPDIVAPALVRFLRSAGIAVADAPVRPATPSRADGLLARQPTYCAGCPHNTSTALPDGSFALAGIGCHIMAIERAPGTKSIAQMGGEGVSWVGLAPFTDMPHIFANMGDGTYQHSGILAIRQALAADTTITFKILFNDAVAMTGGQPAEGHLTVAAIAHQVAAEGVKRIALVADDADRLPPASALPACVTRHERSELDKLQHELRGHKGVSVLIYDQVCATEKRRRRKRGTMAPAAVSVAINPRVCENCGDCTAQSHCIAVEPVETEYGRKRRISPTSCNTDLSCLKGFCPSFVTTAAPAAQAKAHAVDDRWKQREQTLAAELAEPILPHPLHTWRALFAGIGGGGIVTSGAIVAMAAHLEGHQVSTLDFTGLAQKNGAVVSHVQIADGPIDIVRIPTGEADLMLAADLAVAASEGVLERCAPNAVVIGNLDLQSTVAFLNQRDLRIDAGLHRRTIEQMVDRDASRWLRAGAISERLFGTAQVENTLMLGLAWQRGRLPVGRGPLLRAIELNGTAVALNRRAFLWGRILADFPALADEILKVDTLPVRSLAELVAARAEELVAYQNPALAARYRTLVERAAAAELRVAPGSERLARAVAEGYFRVLAYKDEYEVARLHAAATYGEKPVFHLAPPLITRIDPATGRRRKRAIPGWLALPLFRAVRHGKALRGTALDPFGWQEERRMERRLIAEYEADLDAALATLRRETLDIAAELAELPLDIRGYGAVKQENARRAEERRRALRQGLTAAPVAVAAE
jgi:indolepyruvate ferredoxin oxidoreductase